MRHYKPYPWKDSQTHNSGALSTSPTNLRANASPRPIPKLFQPITVRIPNLSSVVIIRRNQPKIRGQTFKNRIVVSPMCMYSSEDGFLVRLFRRISSPSLRSPSPPFSDLLRPSPAQSDFHLVHYGQFALGGAGLILVEATAVEDIGRISPNCAGLWKDEHKPSHQRVVDFVKASKGSIGIQLAHAGRKAATPGHTFDPETFAKQIWTPVAPSPIPWGEGWLKPSELSKGEISRVIDSFVAATNRANEVGYDVVEIHAAHGYLINQFNSPVSNHRTDEYGGSFENRTRLCREVAQAVRKAWPAEKSLWVRLSCIEWVENGFPLEETVKLARVLKEIGVDVIDCSTAGNAHDQKIAVGPGYQVRYAKEVREKAQIPTGAVGLITKSDQAEKILQDGSADFIIMARELLRDPHWPLRAAHELGADVQWANQYERGRFHGQ